MTDVRTNSQSYIGAVFAGKAMAYLASDECSVVETAEAGQGYIVARMADAASAVTLAGWRSPSAAVRAFVRTFVACVEVGEGVLMRGRDHDRAIMSECADTGDYEECNARLRRMQEADNEIRRIRHLAAFCKMHAASEYDILTD